MSRPSFVIKLDSYKTRKLTKGDYPIYLQVGFDSTTRKLQLSPYGWTAFIDEWDSDEGRFKRGARHYKRKNEELDRLEDLAWDIYDELFRQSDFSYQLFADAYRRRLRGTNLFEFLDWLYDDIINQKRELVKKDCSVGTAMTYQWLKGAIAKYVPNANELKLESITEIWLEDFETKCLQGDCNPGGFKSYMRTLKASIGYAVKAKLIDSRHDHFSRSGTAGYSFHHIKSPKKQKEILLPDEMMAIYSHPHKDEMYMHAQNMFTASFCLVGVNFEDIVRLERADIKKMMISINGQMQPYRCVVFNRKKTVNTSGEMGTIPLNGIAQEIFDFYMQFDRRYIFPVLPDDWEGDSVEIKKFVKNYEVSVNRRLGRLAKKLGINKKVTLYTARYSSAELSRINGFDTRDIGKLMCHADERTTQVYFGNTITERELQIVNSLDFRNRVA